MTETPDWKLRCRLEWIPKRKAERIECAWCRGAMFIGGGKFDCEEPKECPTCYGHGTILDPFFFIEPQPQMDKDFAEHMKKAFNQYWEQKEGEAP